ncbi:gliding motility-associated C-terminal domain-containing protein [Allomuricauda sp. SCSIO 65647]|uniref:gliding motility-associated C-terminal domain-containing protein n=1 Tax=Allomuricauda sp. SCSIO 65647 TaxID=2908843 RepID=UPI001F42D587|nr:gliding motility-associated C-terminal domain-containing protein [Muricauda sp. SCSIO 65647]UJH68152.1 gliding motility-associated C-terminal domain-containing protein [Muricauda sp. SCSIO 65647]
MKLLLNIVFLLGASLSCAQTALYKSGNLQVHGNGQIGFHTDLINDGVFDNNQGLVGFYGTETLNVSGAFATQFQDMEVMVDNGLSLNTTMAVTNNANFVVGDIITPKNLIDVYFEFMDDAFFSGENDAAKVDGFVAVSNKRFFSFPVGDAEYLRPLILDSDSNNDLARCAYFFENPSNPTSLSEQFDTDSRVRDIGEISPNEFWIIQGNVPSRVTISWNSRSNLSVLASTPEDLVIVGYNISTGQWVILGNSAFSGDIDQGFMTSETFVPDDFAAITFGTVPLPTDIFVVNNPTLGGYFVSPNGDGINDVLVIDGMEESPNNSIQIFNRFGQKVYERTNYTNEFNGTSNFGNFVINRDAGLPEGIYYYLVTLNDIDEGVQYQGFFFLDR